MSIVRLKTAIPLAAVPYLSAFFCLPLLGVSSIIISNTFPLVKSFFKVFLKSRNIFRSAANYIIDFVPEVIHGDRIFEDDYYIYLTFSVD